MERNIILKRFKKCSGIYDHPDFCLFSGGGFRSMNKNTKKIVSYPEVRDFVLRISFLSGNRLLVEDCMRRYHLLSLDDGIVLKTTKTPRGRSLAGARRPFAVSPDETVAYDIWRIKTKVYMVRIDLEDLTCTPILYRPILNYICDLQCLDAQHLHLLETQTVEIDGAGRTVNQINTLCIDDGGISRSCEKNWISPPGGGAFCLHDTDVIEFDLHRTNWQTDERIDLLEHNSFQWPADFSPLLTRYDPRTDTIQLADFTQNIFVDCAQKKVIARYYTQEPGFIGARIGDSFWIGTDRGIAAVDFPCVETAKDIDG